MKLVIVWLTRHAVVLYLVSLVGAGGYLLSALAAHRQIEEAQFSLERERLRRRERRALFVAVMFVVLGLLIFAVSHFLAGDVGPVQPTPTEAAVGITPLPTATSTASPTPTAAATTTPSATEGVTPTPSPTPAPPTATPTLPPPPPPDCPSPEVQIILPTAGSVVSGKVEVRGTVAINAFAYYKFEVVFPDGEEPNFIARFDTPVENGLLGYWDVSDAGAYPDGGPYRFRLVAVDIYGNTTNCVVPVYISH